MNWLTIIKKNAMKKSFRSMLLCATVVLGFSACSNGEGQDALSEDNNPNTKEYVVSLGMSGEILEIEESPLSKAAGNDLYGVQVYSKTATSEYKPYAYGLFDNKEGMTIRLMGGYQYKFVATMVVDGKTKLNTDTYGAYYDLFAINASATPMGNSFVYSMLEMEHLDWGNTYSSDGMLYNHPAVERFYGETEEYVPEEEGSVSIFMKRVCFGVKYVAEGLTDGKLLITMEKAPIVEMTIGNTEIQEMFCFGNIYPAGLDWTRDDYTETIPVSVTWERADGASVPLANREITFKRNVLTTITIKVDEAYIEGGVDLEQEDTEMTEGENVVIEGGAA